jgi:hypothetical protein
MLNQGFIRLSRGIAEQPWYKDEVASRVFIELLIRASHKPRTVEFKANKVRLTQGQLITTVKIVARKLNIDSESKVKRAIEKFHKLGQIEKQNYVISNRSIGQIITIVNYEKWQKSVQPTVQPSVQPTVQPEALILKGLNYDDVQPVVQPTVQPSVQWNNNVPNDNGINNIEKHACLDNKPTPKISHAELRNEAFEHFWKCWGECKKLIGKKNTAPKNKFGKKFLFKMNDSHVNKLGIEGFQAEVNLMCELASQAHEDIAQHLGTTMQSDYFNYASMYPDKYLSNEQWRECKEYRELVK